MAMTLLEIVDRMCKRQGLTPPTAVTSSTDPQILQLWEFANEILEDLTTRLNWTAQVYEATFSSVAAYDQGSIFTIAPQGFQWIKDKSFWNRTTRLPVFGPLSSADWQEALAVPFSGPWYRYRLEQNNLLIYPAPAAGQTYAFEYQSSGAVANAAGTTISNYFQADTDICMLDGRLVLLGLRWKWRAEKGLPYQEHMRAYEAAVNDLAGNDGTKKTISMAGDECNFKPGIFLPAGNWNLH